MSRSASQYGRAVTVLAIVAAALWSLTAGCLMLSLIWQYVR